MALWNHSLPANGTLDGYILRIAQGDSRGLEELYQSTASGVYAYALSVLKNSHDAEDVLQDCFLRIYESASTYRPQGKPLAWILTVAKNLCYKRLAEQQKMGCQPLEDWKNCADTNPQTTTDDKVVIHACMALLADDERQIVVLHAVSCVKHREIAKMLDIPLSTVLSKYHRALKKLKANF